ncbi:substrate-binding domain-containing protein [Pseudogracilibacillus sp. SO30301A]|uniref:substrate-binding domain-containing protein n=1 Tax=Pseudogracilibacillus sp. SO30301A TaxID=3098291 RepID=UPI00300E4CC8
MEDLKNETLLLTENGCSYRNMFKEALNSFGIYPLDQIKFASVEAIKQCVIAGLGVALLPEMVVKKELEEGKMKTLMWNATLSRLYTQIAWHKDKQMTSPLEAFIELTRETFKPIYGILLIIPYFMFGDALKSTIGLGGTRTNYYASLIISSFLFIVSLMIVNNVFFQLSEFITENTKSTTHVFHIASLFGASNAISYFWVDVLFGIFLVGTGTILSAALYRFGYLWMLGIVVGLGVVDFCGLH